MCMREQWRLHCTSQWGGRHHWVCALCGCAFKMTDWEEQQICLKCCIKLEHSSMESIWIAQKATAMGNWLLTASSGQHTHSCITSHTQFFCEISTKPPYHPDLTPCSFGLVPKLKSPLKEKRFQTVNEIQENTIEQLMVNGKACMRSKGAYFEGDWSVIVLCTKFLVSCLINVSLSHITWLDTFWTDLVLLSDYYTWN